VIAELAGYSYGFKCGSAKTDFGIYSRGDKALALFAELHSDFIWQRYLVFGADFSCKACLSLGKFWVFFGI